MGNVLLFTIQISISPYFFIFLSYSHIYNPANLNIPFLTDQKYLIQYIVIHTTLSYNK